MRTRQSADFGRSGLNGGVDQSPMGLGALGRSREHAIDQRLRFRLDALEVREAQKTLCIERVDFFGCGRTGGEPAAFRDDF